MNGEENLNISFILLSLSSNEIHSLLSFYFFFFCSYFLSTLFREVYFLWHHHSCCNSFTFFHYHSLHIDCHCRLRNITFTVETSASFHHHWCLHITMKETRSVEVVVEVTVDIAMEVTVFTEKAVVENMKVYIVVDVATREKEVVVDVVEVEDMRLGIRRWRLWIQVMLFFWIKKMCSGIIIVPN